MVIIALTVFQAEVLLNRVMRRVHSELEDRGLKLAAAKTEEVLLTKKPIETQRTIVAGDALVQTKAAAQCIIHD